MKKIKLHQIKTGMILAKPIYDNNGIILFNKNVVLNDHFCNQLKQLNIDTTIYVYNDNNIKNTCYYKNVVNETTRYSLAKKNTKFDFDAISYYSTSIVNDARNSSIASTLLLDLFNYSINTFEHSLRVAEISTIIGIAMGLSNKDLYELAISALLHDIGKLKIDLNILHKPGPLTDKEREIVNAHPLLGYEIIKDMDRMPTTIKCAILMHHENEDGTGYPKGINGDQIFKFAKIIHVADVYDALVGARSYKKAFNPNDTLNLMQNKMISMFDKKIFNVFMKHLILYDIHYTRDYTLEEYEDYIKNKQYNEPKINSILYNNNIEKPKINVDSSLKGVQPIIN